MSSFSDVATGHHERFDVREIVSRVVVVLATKVEVVKKW